jgi:hypothetical protein
VEPSYTLKPRALAGAVQDRLTGTELELQAPRLAVRFVGDSYRVLDTVMLKVVSLVGVCEQVKYLSGVMSVVHPAEVHEWGLHALSANFSEYTVECGKAYDV